MAGFKKETKSDVDVDMSTLDVDLEETNLENNNNKRKEIYDDDEDDEYEEKYQNVQRQKQKNSNNKVIIIGLVALTCVVGIGSYTYFSNQQTKRQLLEAEEANRKLMEQQTTETMSVGVPNMYNTNYSGTVNNESVSNSQDFLKDLNEKPIDIHYKISSIETVRDYADYEKKRAIMDDGMEIYWLDLTYKGKKYRMQVPLAQFIALESEKHIALVDIELTTLEDGNQLITYMSIVKNANYLINPGY